MMRIDLGVYLSANLPATTAEMAYPRRKAVYPDDTSLRLQPNSFSKGLKKTPNDHIVSPRHMVTKKQAATTNQP